MNEIRQLERLGYLFSIEGDRIAFKYAGPGEPDPATVDPLLLAIRDRREEALAYLADVIMPIADLPDWRQSRGLMIDRARSRMENGRAVLVVVPNR